MVAMSIWRSRRRTGTWEMTAPTVTPATTVSTVVSWSPSATASPALSVTLRGPMTAFGFSPIPPLDRALAARGEAIGDLRRRSIV